MMAVPDWSVFSQHIDNLAPAQVNHLKSLTRDHLQAGNDEKKARYIKVAYLDDYDGPTFYDSQGDRIVSPRVVLWEEHVSVSGLDASWNKRATDLDTLRKSLRTIYLPDDLRNLKTELYFASMQLKSHKIHSEPETIRHYLLSYCDKIYAKPLSHQSNGTWTLYKNYFNQAQAMILSDASLYTELCRNLKKLLVPIPHTSTAVSEDKIYSYFVLLRSLPDTVARANSGYIEATKSVKELLAVLDILDEDESAIAREATYNIINAIEWLTYLIPKMYGTLTVNSVNTANIPLYEELVERLEKYISNGKYKLAIRMEAAWALGWASISSIGVATCVHQYEKSAKSRVYMLRSEVLRHVVGTAYLRASFTLVSFGPARISSNTVEPLPGTYLSDQEPTQLAISAHEAARRAAANIVYGELQQMVGGNIRPQLLFATLAACWLVSNDLIAVLFSRNVFTTILLAATPILILLITVIQLTWEWGRGYWSRIVTVWLSFVLLVVSPWITIINWYQMLIIVGAFFTFLTIIVGFLSSWLSVLAIFPTILRLLQSKRQY